MVKKTGDRVPLGGSAEWSKIKRSFHRQVRFCLSIAFLYLFPCRSKKNDMTTANETRRPILTLQFKRSLKLHDPKHMQWRTVVQREVRLVVHTMNICKRKFSALSILRSCSLLFPVSCRVVHHTLGADWLRHDSACASLVRRSAQSFA